jgi:gallate decarboxylase subunit C
VKAAAPRFGAAMTFNTIICLGLVLGSDPDDQDEDVDLFDTDDVLWAMQTRYVGDLDTVFVPGVAGHVLDPTQQPFYDPRITAKGTTTKTIFDCTVPFHLKEHFTRAQFQELDASLWAPTLFGKKEDL